MHSTKQKIARLFPRVIFCFFLFVHAALLKGQTYFFDHYSNRDGLAQSKIYGLLHDDKNYLWLGTMAGVSKFDGHTFLNFTTLDGLAPGGVRSMHQDSRGNIWFGHNDGGVSIYNGSSFTEFKLAALLFHSDVTSITEDFNGRLWVTSEKSGAVLVHNPWAPLDSIRYEQYKGKRLSDRVYASMVAKDGAVYLLTDVGVKKYNEGLNNFDTFHPEGLTTYFSISCMFQDSRERFWFGTYHGGLYRYDPSKQEMKIFDIRDGLSSNFISTIFGDRKGHTWIGTWGGGITRIKGEELRIFDNTNGLNDNKIRSIVEDHEGNIMIGSNDNGLFIFKGEKFVRYGEEILANRHVWAIEQDGQDRLWVGTNEGITILDGENQSNVYKQFNKHNSTIGEMIRFLKKDGKNNIWVAAEGSGIYKYDQRTRNFYYYSELNYMLFRDFIITGLEIDSDGNLWAGTNEGITFYNTTSRKGIRITQINGISGNEISCLYLDDDDQLWVGARGKKLNMINTKTIHQVFDTISQANLPTFNFHQNGITRHDLGLGITPRSFVKDKKGTLWIGTEGQGLIKFAGDTVQQKYTRDDGLLANLVNLLETDDEGNIYVGTNKGLNVISPDGRIINYTSSNGFTGIETKDNAVVKDKDGNLWFGTMNGAIKFNRGGLNDEFPEPVIYITGLTINLENYPLSPLVELNYLQNRVGFHYGTVNYTNPEAIRYQYMLTGADGDWLPVTDQTKVTYTSLPPGKYEFKVRAVNYAGVWNEKPASVQLIINPPFYKTWWFILAVILLGIAMLYLYMKLRERKFVKEKKALEQKVRSRTREVTLASRELARKNKNITDSIRYAKRIQLSLLPDEIPYNDTFILFKPKDIVSGDFFWFHNDDDHEFMAAVDCTGHGVPGAFMSIIGHNALNKIVNEYKITKPSEILDQLNIEVSNTLHQQNESSVHDGMDLVLIRINRFTNSIQYSAAFNPLYIIRGNELLEYRGNRFSIGKIRKDKKFGNHEIQLEDGDIIYMFSDGYADQFGGADERKFKASAVKDLLIKIKDKPMDEQKDILNDTIEDWRGTIEQVDDILFIGRRYHGH